MTALKSMSIQTVVDIAQHKGACETLLAASRLLRKHGHHDAALLILQSAEDLVPPPEILPQLPDSWPFGNAPEALL